MPILGREPSWGVKVYSLDAVGDFALFSINNATGSISAVTTLVWNDQPSYALTVRCSDTSTVGPVLSSTMTITISLVQVNTVSISEFQLIGGTPATSGLSVNSSIYNQTLAGNDILVSPAGGVAILLIGSGFGKTAARLARDGQTLSSTTVTATLLGATGLQYSAQSCQVIVANTVIQCVVPQGVGAYLTWNVTVNGVWVSMSLARMGYFPPTLTSITPFGSQQLMPTSAPAGTFM